jgi:hypothetical protein
MRTQRLIVLLLLTACSGGMIGPHGSGGGNATGGGTAATGGGDAAGGGTAGTGGSGGFTSNEFPCEVATVLQGTCQNCHGVQLANGAPMHLITRDDLLAPSNIDSSMTMGERSVYRMRAPTGRMPPLPNDAIATDLIDAFDGWVTSGMPLSSCPSGTGGGSSGTGGGSSGAGGGSSGTGGGGSAFVPDQPFTYLAKIKNVLIGLPPTDAELTSINSDPTQLGNMVTSWMAQPEYSYKMRRFFELAFQQTQISGVDFDDMLKRGQLPINNQVLVQNLEESFARTMLALNAQNKPFTQSMTTTTHMMTTATQAFYALLDVWQMDNNQATRDLFKTANPTLNIVVTSAVIPLSQTLDPTNANYMHWTASNAMAACGADPFTMPATANDLYLLLIGGTRPGSPCATAALNPVLTPADYTDWKMVTIRKPATGEQPTRFFDLVTMRNPAQTELVLNRPHVGFYTTPAFFANWSTNSSNQMRVTINQTLIVATGTQVDGSDTTVPSSTPGLDQTHANQAACVYCHQTLDPTRSILGATYSWNYGVQTVTQYSGQKGLFAYRGVQAPMNTISDLGTTLAAHPLFAGAWVQKLCYWVNSQACDETDPEFTRIAGVFKSSGWQWDRLVKEVVTSPIVTHVSSTLTQTRNGVAIAVTRRDHLCALWNARLGFTDVCGLDSSTGSPLPGTGKLIIPGLPSDGYSRGSTAPVMPNDPSLFYRSGIENLCANISTLVVDATTPIAGTKQWSSTQPTAAISDFVSLVAGLPAGDPRVTGLTTQLTQHFNTAKGMTGMTPTTALRSTFVVACMSPTAASIGM